MIIFFIILLNLPLGAWAEEILTLKGDLEWRSCPADKPIKGNINSFKGSKIYHKPSGAFYNRTNPEACFATEAEAEEKGFRPSSR